MLTATERLTRIEALTTGLTLAWFGGSATTVELLHSLQTPGGRKQWNNCAHYVRNYRFGQSPAPESIPHAELNTDQQLMLSTDEALEAFRNLVAAYNERTPDETGLFYAYLLADPACWCDWVKAIQTVTDRP